MNYNKFSNKIRPVYLFNIFFLLLILSLKLNNYLSDNEDYYEYAIPTYSELVISKQQNREPSVVTHGFQFNYTLKNVCEVEIVSRSYKNANLSYNHLILTKIKTIISTPVYTSNIISILQSNNIWHKSPEEEEVNLG